ELWIHSAQGEWDRPVVTGWEFPKMGTLAGPAISPDATRVAYMMNFIERRGVYVSPVAGGFPTLQALNGDGPGWWPHGSALAFLWLRQDGASVLATMLLGVDQHPQEIPDFKAVCTLPPEWSPSGEWIACGTGKGPLLVSPDGKRQRQLKPLNAAILAWGTD